MTELTKFDPAVYGAPLLYCLLHDDEGDVSSKTKLMALRIVHVLSIRKRRGRGYAPRSLYSVRSIATIVGSSKSTVHRAMAWLQEKDAVSCKGGKYWLVQSHISCDPIEGQLEQKVSPVGDKVSPVGDAGVPSGGHKYKNKNINKEYDIYHTQNYFSVQEELEEHLEPLTDAILEDNRWVSLYRRPMKKYPHIWVSYQDLTTIFEAFEQYGLPDAEFNAPFRLVEQRLKAKPTWDRAKVDCCSWLIGFALKEALDLSIKSEVKNGQKNKRR